MKRSLLLLFIFAGSTAFAMEPVLVRSSSEEESSEVVEPPRRRRRIASESANSDLPSIRDYVIEGSFPAIIGMIGAGLLTPIGIDDQGNSLLHYAVLQDKLALVKGLLQTYGKSLLDVRNAENLDPLSLARKEGRQAIQNYIENFLAIRGYPKVIFTNRFRIFTNNYKPFIRNEISKIKIVMYQFTNQYLINILANQTNAQVEIIVDDNDATIDALSELVDDPRFEIYITTQPLDPEYRNFNMHQKFFIFESTSDQAGRSPAYRKKFVIYGTANATLPGMKTNYENIVIDDSIDVISQFERQFDFIKGKSERFE